jgi:hypothetical protein
LNFYAQYSIIYLHMGRESSLGNGLLFNAQHEPDRRVEAGDQIGARLPTYLSPIYRSFYTAMLQGEHTVPNNRQIRRAVDRHFKYVPLTPLSDEQESWLKADMRRRTRYHVRNTKWRDLAGDTFLLSLQENHPMRESSNMSLAFYGFYAGEEAVVHGKELGIKPLSPVEKEMLLTNPAFFTDAKYTTGRGLRGLIANGTRHLTNEQSEGIKLLDGKVGYESYGYTIDDFTTMLGQVRNFQGKTQNDKLLGLDVGGSNGLGAHDAELLEQNLDVTNITIDPEIGIWPLRGGHMVLHADRLPIEFNEKFDIIFSHLAIIYMRYRDIALENLIRALNIGGILDVHFSSDDWLKQDETPEQINRDITLQFQRMQKLEEQGIIRYLPLKETHSDARKLGESGRVAWGSVRLQKTGRIPLVP